MEKAEDQKVDQPRGLAAARANPQLGDARFAAKPPTRPYAASRNAQDAVAVCPFFQVRFGALTTKPFLIAVVETRT